MDLTTFNSDVATMSSREIAELTGKEHKHVLADIRRMLDELGIQPHEFSGAYKDQQLIDRPCFNIPHKLALALVARYGYNFSVEIFDSLGDELHKVIQALNEFEIPEDIPDMYVYAIKEVNTGNIKLGISKNPLRRLEQLQTGNSSRLELVGYKKAVNGFKDEKELHDMNADKHLIGEWFDSGVEFN